MDLPSWQAAIGMLGSGGVGSAITKGLDMLGKRNRSQAYTMGAVDHAVQTAMQSVTGQLERTEERLERVEGQHQECEANLANVRADLAEAKAEIDKLMSGRIAVPGEPAPKDRP